MKFRIHIKSKKRDLVRIDHFELQENRVNLLFGESGIGKTMIARAIYGLLNPEDFHILINDQVYREYVKNPLIKKLHEESFFVFQEPSSHLNPLMPLSEQLNEGSLSDIHSEKQILKQLWQDTDDESLKKLLDIYPKPYRPSGGEKQRILLAMAFKKIDRFISNSANNQKPLFVFDEPSGSLDDYIRNLFLKVLLAKYNKRECTVLLITHDYSMISELTKNHASNINNFVFKELSRSGNGLQQKDFSAHFYLNWIKGIIPQKDSLRSSSSVLLQVNSSIRVFDRQLIISRDPTGQKPCPLKIEEKEMVYLKAGSGVGKTTLAKVIIGLIKADDFTVQFSKLRLDAHTPLRIWRNKIWAKKAGMVFQHADEALNLNSKVKDVFKGLPGLKKISTADLLHKINLVFDDEIDSEFLNKRIAYLSGGQKQRLNLLRTLILDTDIIILDEPLNGLDFQSIQKIISILREKQQERKGLLLISHNEEIFDHLVAPESIYYLNAKILD
jgi:ABC-type dipeptide/oligopeptide/nickel transport system ATPase subunit